MDGKENRYLEEEIRWAGGTRVQETELWLAFEHAGSSSEPTHPVRSGGA